ncbi:RCC1 domain-containing protein, partial [Myxococcota bacterium]|nr:RCC1 domain-containing protein [Myxococcota bacterium]
VDGDGHFPAGGCVGGGDDCDDGDATAFPGAAEVCDGDDEDCDGLADEGLDSPYHPDADGDGYGDDTVTAWFCAAPGAGYSTFGGDCDDTYYNTEGLCRWTSVGAGRFHVCAIREGGAVECFGLDYGGSTSPPGGSFRQVAVGTYHSCGLRDDGTIECWGQDTYGQSSPPSGTY